MAQALLMANRRRGQTTEAEPITIDTDDPAVVVLRLEDGETIELDPIEARRALGADDHRAAA